MGREQLVREAKQAALALMEDSARTVKDFRAVVKQWDHLDENEARRVRYHEMQRDEKTLEVGYTHGMIFPAPVVHPAWREALKGDFASVIFHSSDEMWQIIEDWDIAALIKKLTDKQKQVLFLRAVRLCTAAQIAFCYDKTDRAVRKLFTATIESVRDELAPLVREQIKNRHPDMTVGKRHFLYWYDMEKAVKEEKALAEKRKLENSS